MTGRMLSGIALALAVLSATGQPEKPKEVAPFEVADVKLRVSGPYVHENMTVFLLHAKDQDNRDFLTLDEGLAKKLVKVTEQEKEQVGSLLIDNTSDRPLFLQEGDRVQGGNQDRIIVTSLVVPPGSGKMKLPTFCCESGRWAPGRGGKMFSSTSNTILAGQSIRAAAKGGGGQGEVWDRVAKDKKTASEKLGSSNTNSSLNETLDSAQVKKVCDACAKVMNELPTKHPDAVGVAIAVNGKVEEINLYPNAKLLGRIFPRLVQSYAVQAALEKDALKGKPAPAVKTEDVEKFMSAGKEKSRRFEGLNDDNRIRSRELEGEVEFATAYKGQVIHRQWFNRAAVPAPEKRDKK